MNVAAEKFKFKALLSIVYLIPDSLHKELEYQRERMLEAGISGSEIDHLIHDSKDREGISPARAFLALAAVRNNAGIPDPLSMRGINKSTYVPSPSTAADVYMRQKGGGTKRPLPTGDGQHPKRSVVIRPTTIDGLAVPYGVDTLGKLVSAVDALAEERYCCLGCAEPLVLRAGEYRVKHFAHKVGSRCDGESTLHQIAKELVARVINEIENSEKELRLACNCRRCFKAFDFVLGRNAFDRAKNEVQEGVFRCDVMAYRGDQAVLAIEVLNTHAVDYRKGQDLGVSWIELLARDIIDNPYYWRPTQERLKGIACPSCRELSKAIGAVARKHGQLLPVEPYVGAVMECYKCRNEIVVYWWPGVPFAEFAPPSPAPRSIEYRSSRDYGGSYWANTCPCCSALQGDNYVFLATNSPFSTLSMRDVGQSMPRVTVQREGANELFRQKLLKNI